MGASSSVRFRLKFSNTTATNKFRRIKVTRTINDMKYTWDIV